jgi:hypothetical protein
MAIKIASEVIQDMNDAARMKRALREAAQHFEGITARLRFDTDMDPQVVEILTKAVHQEIAAVITLPQLKLAVKNNVEARIAAIQANYTFDIEEG